MFGWGRRKCPVAYASLFGDMRRIRPARADYGCPGDAFWGNRHREPDGRSDFGFPRVSGILLPDREMKNPPTGGIGEWADGSLFESTPKTGKANKGGEIAIDITDSTSRTDRFGSAIREPLRLTGPVPLPPEVILAEGYLSRTPASDILASWKSQIRRHKDIARAYAPMKAEWDRMTPKHIMGASASIKSVAIRRRTSQFGPGGLRSAKQFAYGFDVVGTLPQCGLFTPNDMGSQPASPTSPFSYAASRVDTRAKESGRAHGGALWSDAIDEAGHGRLGPPRPLIYSDGSLFLGGRVNADFSFAVIQMDKIRALTTSNTDASIWTAPPGLLSHWPPGITLGEISLGIPTTDQLWTFSKAAHKAAYKKNAQIKPVQADACVATIRNPSFGIWYGLRPRTLLSGAVSDVVRYIPHGLLQRWRM